MILVVCQDDPDLLMAARGQVGGSYGNLSEYSGVGPVPARQLGQTEDLFITAHGAMTNAGDGKNPVIGDKKGGLTLNAVQLAGWLRAYLLPGGYSGRIFISACKSANYSVNADVDFSFAEALKNILHSSYPNIRVFGQIGEVGLAIPAPHAGGAWTEATI